MKAMEKIVKRGAIVSFWKMRTSQIKKDQGQFQKKAGREKECPKLQNLILSLSQ